MKYVSSLLTLLILLSCQQGEQVEIQTAGVFASFEVQLDGTSSLNKTVLYPEFLLDGSTKDITVTIKNNTEFPITEIELEIEFTENTVTKFKPNDEGEAIFPGAGGTCQPQLQAHQSCTMVLEFAPRLDGVYTQNLFVKFKNYIRPESHQTAFEVVAGNPASLVFTNDTTQYSFGELIGIQQLPIVERAETTTYTQNLEITNAGGLSARNMVLSLEQECTSSIDGSCPASVANPYSMTHNCPARLEFGEKCQIQVTYLPRNQDLDPGPTPDNIKEIRYRSTVVIDYVASTSGETAKLNGYFDSTSTTIEAIFKVPITQLNFDVPLVSGNRDQRTIKINNSGYRAGEIKEILFEDSSGGHMASCVGTNGSEILTCYDSTYSTPYGLDQFPFFIKDKNNCVPHSGEAPSMVAVGSGCLFDIFFQPSATFTTDRPNLYQNMAVSVIYDSRYKGNETILTKKLFDLSASSLAPAKIIVEDISLQGSSVIVGIPDMINDIYNFDLGRTALQSPSFYKRKTMNVVFRNLGSATATNIQISDGDGVTIPLSSDVPAGVNLGPYSPYYYEGALANSDNCREIAPGAQCTISMRFSPIGRGDNAEENDNMFDLTDGSGDEYKAFRITYDDGSTYSDTNLTTTTRDIPARNAQGRLYATLLRKGLLQELSDIDLNRTSFGYNPAHEDTLQIYLFLRNIGTGAISYINQIDSGGYRSYTPIATADPASLGADNDCLNIVDSNSGSATPAGSRVGNGDFTPLNNDETCVFTLEYTRSDQGKSQYRNGIPPGQYNEAVKEVASRFFDWDVTTTELWEFPTDYSYSNFSVRYEYYDGDTTDPDPPPSYDGNLGNRYVTSTFSEGTDTSHRGKLIPNSPNPWYAATLYRPGYTLPDIGNGEGAVNIPEAFFFGGGLHYQTGPNESPPLATNKSYYARDYLPGLGVFNTNTSNYDYIYYVGAYTQKATTKSFSLKLTNMGMKTIKLTNLAYSSTDPAFTPGNSLTLPTNVSSSDDRFESFTLDISNPGIFTSEITYTYESGENVSDPIIFLPSDSGSVLNTNSTKKSYNINILVIGEVIASNAVPVIDLSLQNYTVVAQESGNPIETFDPTVIPMSTSFNTTDTATSVYFDSLKIEGTPGAEDIYDKKRITITNNGTVDANNLSVVWKSSTSGSATVNGGPTQLSVLPSSTCSGLGTLAAGNSCYFEYKYQPLSSSAPQNLIYSVFYEIGSDRYEIKNAKVDFFPRSPAYLEVVGKTAITINYQNDSGSNQSATSYPLNIGNSNRLVSIPLTFTYDQNSGAQEKLRVRNLQPTKASLLKTYHDYLTENSLKGYSPASPAPSSEIPDPGDYRTVDGFEFAVIYKTTYGDGSDRLVLEASKGCLFGDDENDAGVEDFKKGFDDSTTLNCYLIPTLNANFMYLNEDINKNNGLKMRENSFQIHYYTVNRSTTSFFRIHFQGKILPARVNLASGSMTNIYSTDAKITGFEVPNSIVDPYPAVGNIVGYRVIQTETSGEISDPYSTSLDRYVDLDTVQTSVEFNSNMSNGRFYYYKMMAIKYDARFTDNTKFLDLQPGEYLAEITGLTNALKIPVPPLDHFYDYSENVIVQKDLHGGQESFDLYSDALSNCSSKPVMLIKDGTLNRTSPYKMINRDIWEMIRLDPLLSNYPDYLDVAHWLNEPKVSIDSVASHILGYDPNASSQTFEGNRLFYIRDSDDPANTVRQLAGGVPGTSNSDFDSYVAENIPFGSTRCMANVP